MTRVKVQIGNTTIKCSAVYATILVAINKTKCVDDIDVGLTKNDLLDKIGTLVSFGILFFDGTNVRVNTREVELHRVIEIPFVIPMASDANIEKITDDISAMRKIQLDCLIVSRIKSEKAMQTTTLLNYLRSKVKFDISEAMLDERTHYLERLGLIRIDRSGTLFYLY